MIKLKELLKEDSRGFRTFVTTKDAMVRYNKKPSGGTVGSLQFASQGYVKVPKGTFLIDLPGGLFAVNTNDEFAFPLTSSTTGALDAQDKLDDRSYSEVPSFKAPSYNQWKKYL